MKGDNLQLAGIHCQVSHLYKSKTFLLMAITHKVMREMLFQFSYSAIINVFYQL